MLTKDQKKKLVSDLSEKIKTAKSVAFVDFRGVNVKDLSALKKEIRKSEGSFKVVKKTLINLAFKDSGIKYDVKKLEGQIAIALSDKDEIAAPKILFDFSRRNENVKILGGILETKELSAEEMKALAKLPSREELLAKLAGAVNAPVSGFVNVLAGNLRGLVQVLKSIGESKA